MAYGVKDDEFGLWNGLGQIFCMFSSNKFLMLTLYDGDWHTDLRKIVDGVVRLRLLHQADGCNQVFEAFLPSR